MWYVDLWLITGCRFPKKSPGVLCWLSVPLAEATDSGLTCFVGVSVKVSGVEGPGCSSTTTKKVGCPLGCCCSVIATWLC